MVRFNEKRGTTLAELLVALAFAGVAAAAIIGATTQASKLSRQAKERAVALTLAQESLESARRDAKAGVLAEGAQDTLFTDTGEVFIIDIYGVNPVPSPPVTNQGIKGDVTVTRTVEAEPGSVELYRVTAIATWNSPDAVSPGQTTLKLETLMRCPGE
jgi:type II secretory pathway pseudopilin PulG